MDYGRKRRIYGDKLNRLQDYRFRISQMEAEIAAMRGLLLAAVQRIDSGEDPTKEASIAKMFTGQTAMSSPGSTSISPRRSAPRCGSGRRRAP